MGDWVFATALFALWPTLSFVFWGAVYACPDGAMKVPVIRIARETNAARDRGWR